MNSYLSLTLDSLSQQNPLKPYPYLKYIKAKLLGYHEGRSPLHSSADTCCSA